MIYLVWIFFQFFVPSTTPFYPGTIADYVCWLLLLASNVNAFLGAGVKQTKYLGNNFKRGTMGKIVCAGAFGGKLCLHTELVSGDFSGGDTNCRLHCCHSA